MKDAEDETEQLDQSKGSRSSLPVGKGKLQSSIKKARVELKPVQAKKEAEEWQAASGAAVEAAEVVVIVTMEKAKLDCPLCSRPLKPPIFQCDGGHLACGGCRGHDQLANSKCYKCGLAGSYGRNPALEDFLNSGMTRCPNAAYGCGASAAYCEVDAHLLVCPCAPCCWPARGCAFLGSPPLLRDHIPAEHGDPPPVTFRYGQELMIGLRVERCSSWRALVGDEDGGLFVVGRRALGAVTAVSLVCVRANAAVAQRYSCRLAVKLPSGGGDEHGVRVVAMESSEVASSALTCQAPDYGMFVGAHQLPLSGDTLLLSIRIDKLRPASDEADNNTAKSQIRISN